MAERTCSIDGCEGSVSAKGMCSSHYNRMHRYGDPFGFTPRPKADPLVRFMAKVDQHGPIAANVPALGRCWIWAAGRDPKNYGTFKVDDRGWKAHRWIWEYFNGPVPDGLELDHFACDRRECVNPAHVHPVTHKQNMARGAHARKTHCPRGHPYDEENTYLYRGRRSCRTCASERLVRQ